MKLRAKWPRVSPDPTASTIYLQTPQFQVLDHKPLLRSHLPSVDWPRLRLAKCIMTTLSDLGLLEEPMEALDSLRLGSQ